MPVAGSRAAEEYVHASAVEGEGAGGLAWSTFCMPVAGQLAAEACTGVSAGGLQNLMLLPMQASRQLGRIRRVQVTLSACAGQKYPTLAINSNYGHIPSTSNHGEHCLQAWPDAVGTSVVDRLA